MCTKEIHQCSASCNTARMAGYPQTMRNAKKQKCYQSICRSLFFIRTQAYTKDSVSYVCGLLFHSMSTLVSECRFKGCKDYSLHSKYILEHDPNVLSERLCKNKCLGDHNSASASHRQHPIPNLSLLFCNSSLVRRFMHYYPTKHAALVDTMFELVCF